MRDGGAQCRADDRLEQDGRHGLRIWSERGFQLLRTRAVGTRGIEPERTAVAVRSRRSRKRRKDALERSAPGAITAVAQRAQSCAVPALPAPDDARPMWLVAECVILDRELRSAFDR